MNNSVTPISVAAQAGQVTVESPACRWGLLALPEREYVDPQGRQVWSAPTVCELKVGPYVGLKRPTTLKLFAEDVAAIYMALGEA